MTNKLKIRNVVILSLKVCWRAFWSFFDDEWPTDRVSKYLSQAMFPQPLNCQHSPHKHNQIFSLSLCFPKTVNIQLNVPFYEDI